MEEGGTGRWGEVRRVITEGMPWVFSRAAVEGVEGERFSDAWDGRRERGEEFASCDSMTITADAEGRKDDVVERSRTGREGKRRSQTSPEHDDKGYRDGVE